MIKLRDSTHKTKVGDIVLYVKLKYSVTHLTQSPASLDGNCYQKRPKHNYFISHCTSLT